MIDIFGKEFELMCYVKDTRALNGICTFEEVIEKFGEPLIKKLMMEENFIGYCKFNSNGLDWTELGWTAMSV
jgi:hypothetical protein